MNILDVLAAAYIALAVVGLMLVIGAVVNALTSDLFIDKKD